MVGKKSSGIMSLFRSLEAKKIKAGKKLLAGAS